MRSPRRLVTRLRLGIGFAIGASLAAGGQQPRFQTGVEATVVEVSVLDHSRRPVRGLTAADFTILEDGQRQHIDTFSAVDFASADGASAAWTRTVQPDVHRSGDFADRRLITIVLDDATPMAGGLIPRARTCAKAIIGQMGPRDLASVVYALDRSRGQDFTSDQGLLDAAADRFIGGGQGGQFVWAALLDTLRGVAQNLSLLPQHRKLLVLISSGIPVGARAQAPEDLGFLRGRPDGVNNNPDFRFVTKKVDETLQAARRANVTIYAIDPIGLEAPTRGNPVGFKPERDFLITLADGAGGFAVVDTNDIPTEVGRIYRENASCYLLGYASPNRRNEGKERRIDVRVNRPEFIVRTRSGYLDPGSAPRTARPIPGAPIWTALAASTPDSGVLLQVVAHPLPVLPGRLAAVPIVIGVRQPDAATAAVPSPEDRLDVLVNAYDMRGSRQAGTQLNARVRPSPDAHGEVGYEILTRLNLPGGRYQLRVAAHASGTTRSGSVFCDLDVPDFSKSHLALSALAFSAPAGVAVASPDPMAGLLPFVPTSTREFLPTDHVQVFARVSQGGKQALAPVTLHAHLIDARSATVLEDVRILAVDQFARGRTTDVTITLPLARLEAGEFLLTLQASSPQDTARRDARFAVRAR